MNKTFFLILISVFLFIGINTIFYFTIYKQQLDFQTELLSRQISLCGNTIEQEGQRFENELNSIPYQDDFSKLFSDEDIKERGAINLHKLFTGYSQLINKITVFDNHNNVYSLILDRKKNNFVSDYYESQQQVSLNERDQLSESPEKFLLSIPGFDDNGIVKTNIVVDLNFTRFVNDIFERYGLEHTLWQCLVSGEGDLLSTAESDIRIAEGDLKRIGSNILEVSEGSLIHTITIDSVATRVVSVYYPVRILNRDLGIIFSIKTDLFLRSIIIKFIIITLCSLALLALLLYVHFRVRNGKSEKLLTQKLSEETLLKTLNILPVGLILVNPDGGIRLMNHAARKMLFHLDENNSLSYSGLGLDDFSTAFDNSIYQRAFGPGSTVLIRHKSNAKHIYKMEWISEMGEIETKIVMLVDVSDFENSRKLDKTSHLARTELLESMAREISVPLSQLRKTISESNSTSVESLQKTCSLLSNLINATMDFAGREAGKVVIEEIPFCLRPEIDLAIEPFRGKNSNTSIITKIGNDVPDKLVGDPFRLRQAIFNLVENAFELTSEGRILISSEVLEHHSAHLKLQFHIEDTGNGLPADKIEELMNEAERSGIKPAVALGGFKLRLATARQHIELMRGQLWMETPSSISTSPDQPGIKYTFTIEIFSGESLKENLVFKDIERLEEIECLFLSQEKDYENELSKPLLDLGIKLKYLIYREENTGSLFELVLEKAPSMHLLIIIDSATQDGFRVAEELTRRGFAENLITVVLSSAHKPENYSRSRNARIDYYIEKPYESYRLFEILSKHFPGLAREELSKVPRAEKPDPNLSILLAEDNLFNRKVVQGLFKGLGLDIDMAENGEQAVKMVSRKKYDVIFIDLLMPEMDGLQAAAEIRKQGLKMPIIALTAVEGSDTRKAAMGAGFNDYLIKPASVESLRKILLNSSSQSV